MTQPDDGSQESLDLDEDEAMSSEPSDQVQLKESDENSMSRMAKMAARHQSLVARGRKNLPL